MTDPSLPLDPRAEVVFREYLAHVEAGGSADFEAICRANPTVQADLRRLKDSLDVIERLRPPKRHDRPLSERLKQQFGTDPGPTASLDDEPRPDSGSSSTLFDKLRGAGTRGTRYKLLGEVARGGMGVILKIWDDELRRTLAMKVVLGRGGESKGDTPHVDPKTLGRFLEEAQVTGQLDHPGIVPVHELGLGADGRVYFTMRLVKGEDLRTIFEKVRTGEDGWNQVRALGVLLKVCEAMSYAHSKKVVHRDLKPANVMVGKFGEVYVMDWGLARVLGREDKHDLRIQQPTTQSVVKTERRERREETPDSPLVTMDGDVVGTPSFMPPEQAKGQLDRLGPHSDVYALGAMLYQLLSGQMPYVPLDARLSQRTILARLIDGPPHPIESLAPGTPPEMVAICEKAMAREVSARYADTKVFASDLRAYLEGRVVRAYEAGTWAETRKWVRRNRPLAASLASAVGILIAGTITSTVLWKSAREKAAEATRSKDDVVSLSAQQDLDDLIARAESLWPAHPEMIDDYRTWLLDARALIDGRAAEPGRGIRARPGLPEHMAKLAELRSRAKAQTGMGPASATDVGAGRSWEFADAEDRWWHLQLSRLVSELQLLADPAKGLMGDNVTERFGWGVRKRCAFAEQILERSVVGADAKQRWSDALASIRVSPRYEGLDLSPQVGLLPIGADPDSGLWEFAQFQSGKEPLRGPDGRLILTEESSLVFVLIPGGSFWMGAQKDLGHPNHDPNADDDEAPVREVTLAPFFLSKYEMTQGQWLRVAGRNPSHYGPSAYQPDWNRSRKPWSALLPVEQVSWLDCSAMMHRMDLETPTEEQWEYGCRGGTSTVYWGGNAIADLRGVANIPDEYAKQHGYPAWDLGESGFDDGNSVSAEVGSYRANDFGLHDVHGNVWEWCRDGYGADSRHVPDEGHVDAGSVNRVFRGGCFDFDPGFARSANREFGSAGDSDNNLGLRPARSITP